MFADPLFDFKYMNKEIDAINSENEKNLNKDAWRELQVIKQLANKDSPFNKFSTGNNSTLRGIDPKNLNFKLRKLYEKYYLPQNMKLVILCIFFY